MKKYLNKLHYRSWHRGTKEADLFLGNFFDHNQDKDANIMEYQEIKYLENFKIANPYKL